MANGDAFNLQHFLDTCDASKRFVTEDEYKAGKYPQLRPNVWKEYANREPRFYASVAFSGAFWPFASAKDAEYRNPNMVLQRQQRRTQKRI